MHFMVRLVEQMIISVRMTYADIASLVVNADF